MGKTVTSLQEGPWFESRLRCWYRLQSSEIVNSMENGSMESQTLGSFLVFLQNTEMAYWSGA